MSKPTQLKKIFHFTPILIYACYLIWWVFLNYFDAQSKINFDTAARYNFTDTYGVVALATSIVGISIANKWGLLRSRFGKSLTLFSLGALLQFLGQLTYALYYRVGDVYLAFPSVGDIPYMLSYLFYVVAIYQLLKVILFNQSIFKSKTTLLFGSAATVGLIVASYYSFLNIAIQDERGLIFQILNVAYPAVQSLYFLLGIVALMHARRIDQGKLFLPVGLVLTALIVQYIADFSFLYQSYHETWKAAAVNDLIFMTAYALMAVAIILIDRVRVQVLTPVEKAEGSE